MLFLPGWMSFPAKLLSCDTHASWGGRFLVWAVVPVTAHRETQALDNWTGTRTKRALQPWQWTKFWGKPSSFLTPASTRRPMLSPGSCIRWHAIQKFKKSCTPRSWTSLGMRYKEQRNDTDQQFGWFLSLPTFTISLVLTFLGHHGLWSSGEITLFGMLHARNPATLCHTTVSYVFSHQIWITKFQCIEVSIFQERCKNLPKLCPK